MTIGDYLVAHKMSDEELLGIIGDFEAESYGFSQAT